MNHQSCTNWAVDHTIVVQWAALHIQQDSYGRLERKFGFSSLYEQYAQFKRFLAIIKRYQKFSILKFTIRLKVKKEDFVPMTGVYQPSWNPRTILLLPKYKRSDTTNFYFMLFSMNNILERVQRPVDNSLLSIHISKNKKKLLLCPCHAYMVGPGIIVY